MTFSKAFLRLSLALVILCFHQVRAAEVRKPASQSSSDNIDPGIYILKHHQFAIEAYYDQVKAYHVKRPDVPDGDGLYVTSKNLLRAVTSLNRKQVLAKPTSIVGNVYSTDNDMALVEDEEVARWTKQQLIGPEAKANAEPNEDAAKSRR